MRTEQVGRHNFWTVYDDQDHERGTVNGDGPTRDTRFKAIRKEDGWMSPDVAPAVGYGRTLDEAAKLLVAEAS